MRRACVALALWLAGSDASADARSVVPAKKTRAQRRAEARSRDMSQGGERRGGIEIALGSFGLALAVGLIGRGGWEVVNAQRLARRCGDQPDDPACLGPGNPVVGAKVAAGLSFAFAVPVAIGGGFLLAHGLRIRRDWKAWHARQRALSLVPSAGPTGAGLALRLRV
jgi:hypothetical protein